MALPKAPRAAFYRRGWMLVDKENCDIRIVHGIATVLQPRVLLPVLARLANSALRASELQKLGKTKQEVLAMARGQGLSADDRKNKLLMELRDDLEIAGRILEQYRPDLVEDALLHGKSKHSVRSRACQAIEDQQL